MNADKCEHFLQRAWSWEGNKGPVVRFLEQYITIPNDSPNFDPQWSEHGHMDRAVDLFLSALKEMNRLWEREGCETRDVTWKVLSGRDNHERDPTGKRRTPLLIIDVPAYGQSAAMSRSESVLLYGHLDKQPALEGKWSAGLGPRQPVIRDGKLYGRGGADDGYAMFSAYSAIMSLRAQGTAHARCVIIIESCEESGSLDLEHYVTKLLPELGDIRLIVCLDSGCENYERLWTTGSLRGMVSGVLKVDVAREGVHSGDASGIEPSSFRIMRRLLSRLENEDTGTIEAPELNVDIPGSIRKQATDTATIVDEGVYRKYPLLDGVRPVTEDLTELVLNRTWRPQLAVIGIDGLPATTGAGNVMLPFTHAGLSFRLPPGVDSAQAAAFIKTVLEKDPPHQARVTFDITGNGDGWAAPEQAAWLALATDESSRRFFGRDSRFMGEGGSIPFMSMLARVFPKAQFLVTGVLGPQGNAHGPDEMLHLPMARKVTMCVAGVLAAHAAS